MAPFGVPRADVVHADRLIAVDPGPVRRLQPQIEQPVAQRDPVRLPRDLGEPCREQQVARRLAHLPVDDARAAGHEARRAVAIELVPVIFHDLAQALGLIERRGVGVAGERGVLVPGEEPPAVEVVVVEIAAVVVEGVGAAAVGAITVLEVVGPGLCAVQVHVVARAPVHQEVAPQVVALGVAVDVGVGDGVARDRFGHGRGFGAGAPGPAPFLVGGLFVGGARHGHTADQRLVLVEIDPGLLVVAGGCA